MKAAAILASIMLILLTGCAAAPPPELPEDLTLYLTQEKRIISLTREEYLSGCIAACADPSFQPEALKAIAAASCGHALSVVEKRSPGDFLGADLSDDPAVCPQWADPSDLDNDSNELTERLTEAAVWAAELSPRYDSEPAFTPVMRTSTGQTDDGGFPWLPPLELPEDADSPWYSSSCTVPTEYARKALREFTGSVILPPDPAEWFTGAEYTPGGVLTSIRFGDAELNGEQLRQAFGLRSSAVTVTMHNSDFLLTSRGCGSNIGMSAYYAERLARRGWSAREILSFFYPGVDFGIE